MADGYRVYRGVGGIENVDFDTIVASVGSGATSIEIVGAGHDPSTRYTYVLRPFRGDSSLETPDRSCRVVFETDGAGDWVGNRPAAVHGLDARVEDAADIELVWQYQAPYGQTAPADFGIYYSSSPNIVRGSPDTTQAYSADGRQSKTISLTGGQTYWFAVTARTAGGVESELSAVVGPLVADDTAPDAPTVYVAAGF